jgi:hypothetical protein
MANIYCHGEPGVFPDTEFLRDQNGQLHIPYIHKRGSDHYSSGQPLIPSRDPSLSIKLDLAEQLHKRALVMSEEELRDLINYVKSKYDYNSNESRMR